MPVVSVFLGVVVRMYHADQAPPHFHATYGEYDAIIEIDSGRVLAGRLPSRVRSLVDEWRRARLSAIERAWRDPKSFVVKLAYADGSVVEVSLASLFQSPRGLAAEVMRGGLFDKCFVESGALAWPNGLELCPDALLMEESVAPAVKRAARRSGR